MGAEGCFLVVDDDAAVASGWERLILRHLPSPLHVRIAHTLAEARALLFGPDRFVAALLDYKLPDGTCLDLIPELRLRWPTAQVFIATSVHLSDALIREFQAHAVRLAIKPMAAPEVQTFVTEVALLVKQEPTHAERVRDYLVGRGLTAVDIERLPVVLHAPNRADAAERLGITEDAVKSFIRKILRKCDAPNLRVLAGWLMEL